MLWFFYSASSLIEKRNRSVSITVTLLVLNVFPSYYSISQ